MAGCLIDEKFSVESIVWSFRRLSEVPSREFLGSTILGNERGMSSEDRDPQASQVFLIDVHSRILVYELNHASLVPCSELQCPRK